MGDSQYSQAGQGAIGGAMTGAALGSVVPGIGTGIGALAGGVLGGLGGWFGDQGQSSYQDQLKALADKYGSTQAPQAGPAAGAGYSGFRQNQAGLIAQLEAMARGQGPSAAAIQMREAMDRAAATQASVAAGAGGRGVNAGQANRVAANNVAAIQTQGARDTATMRAQEQLNAIQQLGGVINQGRAADEGVNMFNAGQTNDMAKANLMAQLQTMGITSEAQLRALLAAMGAAGPGFGTQLLAGGAQAFPSMLGRGGGAPTPVDPNGAAGGGYANNGVPHVGGYDSQGNGYGYGGNV